MPNKLLYVNFRFVISKLLIVCGLCIGICGLEILLLFVGDVHFAHAAEEHFPFLAEVSSPSVNIRAGQHLNFEKLGRLTKGQQVIVVGKEYSWYKIKLPGDAQSYISQDFVQLINPDTGLVKSDRVNIRAGAGASFTVLGQLKKGTTVKILEKLNRWYRIEAVEGTRGWISQQYLSFKSNQIPSRVPLIHDTQDTAQKQIPSPSGQSPSPIPVPTAEIKEIKSTEAVSVQKAPGPVSVIGRVENINEGGFSDDIRHKLIVDDHMIYYLKGYKNVIDEFVSYQVQVEGNIQQEKYLRHPSPYPVIVVFKINLVL